jgi:Glycosyltransferase family 87
MTVLIDRERLFEISWRANSALTLRDGKSLKSTIVQSLRDAPWLNRTRLTAYPRIFVAAFVLSVAGWFMAGHGMIDPAGKPLGPDFMNFYAASAQTLAGHPLLAYDFARHATAERAIFAGQPVDIHLFNYPPTFLLIVLPLAILPYGWSFIAWTALTGSGYVATIRKLAPATETLWLTLAFPGTWMNALTGQNAFLSSMLLGAGLLTLDSRPLLAGALFGLLTYKPQLMLLVPIVLAASGRWRALFATTISALGFAAIALLMFGADSWRGFFAIGSLGHEMMLGDYPTLHIVQQTLLAELRYLGAPAPIAYAIQIVCAVLAGGAVIWIWRRPVSFRIKAAALVTGGLIVTPYLGYYDLALLALPIAWLGYEGCETAFLPYEKVGLLAAWLLPLLYSFPLAQLVIIPFLGLIVRRASASGANSAATVG